MTAKGVDDGIKLVTEDLFHDILEKQFGRCTIKKFTVVSSSGAGENYACSLYRVTIEIEKEDGTEDSVRYLTKMVPPNDPNAQMKKYLEIFPKEALMYEKAIPKLEEVFQENNMKISIGPKCWKVVNNLEMLIIEDLGVRKFSNADRLNGMDIEHAKMVLSKLAQFHAASACVFEKDSTFSKQIISSLMSEQAFGFFRIMQPMLWGTIIKYLKMWETCQEYVNRMEEMVSRMGDLYVDVYTPKPDEFNVLLHGDLWVNNIMFQHDENGQPKDILLIDYQMARYGSPVQDLIYFILSSTEYSIKVSEFDYMIKYYHRELVKNLELLKYPKAPPTLIDLHVAVVKKCYLGIVVSTGVMPMALLDPSEDANMDNFMKDNEAGHKFRLDMYLNPRLIRACESIFPFLENRGAFDI
ncbi:uncharacterized protein LOC119658746 [Hermetia illucens]|nr:uncharacterized protein LOC119658746 [Hermetia illucens]